MIVDEYRMTNQKGELIVHGMNFRSYSVEKKRHGDAEPWASST
jgi:hypothetical protein